MESTATLWREFAAPLRAFVARRTPAGVDTEDVLQDVFLRIQEQLPGLRDAARVDAWIFQIARNVLADAFRRRGRHEALTAPSAGEPAFDAEVEAPSAEAALASCLAPMIARLSEPYREAILLTELCGMSQVEAARHVGISISGMKSRVQRGRDQLAGVITGACRIELDVRGGVMSCSRKLRLPDGSNDSMCMTNPDQTKDTETTTTTGCCGGAAPAGSSACCALDAEVKQSGGTGCGCGSKPQPAQPAARKGCC